MMTRSRNRQIDIGEIRFDVLDFADLHFVIAVGNNAIACLDVGRLNFQLQLSLIKGLNAVCDIRSGAFERNHK